MNNIKLKPCPLCGGSVSIALMGNQLKWFSITRGTGEDKCTCGLFMPSDLLPTNPTTEDEERIKKELADRWNTRKSNTELEKVKEAFSKVGKAISKANEDVYKEDMKTEYNKGMADAWELARKIAMDKRNGGFGLSELTEVFGYNDMDAVFMSYTPQEALAKLKAYEEQSKIEVGDVVERTDDSTKGLVLDIDDADPCVWVLTENECVEEWDFCDIKKTDRHIGIVSLINRIREV